MSAATIAIIVVVAVVVLVVSAMAMTRRRLQQRFGPEYDRVVAEKHSQFRGATELARRERRVQRLRIRPLSATARAAYAAEWKTTQEGFVDHPQHAVIEGQELVASVMKERGYPAEDPDQIAADLSVTHASTLDHYRTAQQIGAAAERGDASTEDLRQALIHLRAVFGEVLSKPEASGPDAVMSTVVGHDAVEPDAPEPVAAGPDAAGLRELPKAGPRVPDGAEPRLPEDDAMPQAADRVSDGAQSREPQEQLWRPVRVPQARTSEEQEASQ
jgi:hypothetical protein